MTKHDPVVPIQAVAPWTDAQRATLNALLDLMIPASADGTMPAASSLGLFDHIDDLPAKVRAGLAAGLDAIAKAADERLGAPLAQVPNEHAMAFVQAVRAGAAPFFTAFTAFAVARYYQHDLVMTRLGLELRPPWPQGHELEDGDWSMLEAVRARGPIFREV
ncbi:MAG: gluconate 2-dehydrogenase subunit 3 family protein [Burkholderiaceae bacterium]